MQSKQSTSEDGLLGLVTETRLSYFRSRVGLESLKCWQKTNPTTVRVFSGRKHQTKLQNFFKFSYTPQES